MKGAFDEIIRVAVKRAHEPRTIVGDLLQAEIAGKQARSIKCQVTIRHAAAHGRRVFHAMSLCRNVKGVRGDGAQRSPG